MKKKTKEGLPPLFYLWYNFRKHMEVVSMIVGSFGQIAVPCLILCALCFYGGIKFEQKREKYNKNTYRRR